jgi:ABC-2 type transport system ATP-binding protein
MTAAVQTNGLSTRYGRAWALRDCTTSLPSGSVAALVGPNGAGKTTLLNLIIGLLKPTAGTVSVFGWSPVEDPDLVLARVGFLAQDSPLFRSFSVADMFRFGQVMNRRWDQAAAEDRMRRRGIPLDKKVQALSGGQHAQVALAVALAKVPDLLLLDEPLASLDPLARSEFLQELMESAADGSLTVLLSSHLIGDLERVCDHLFLLNQGILQLAGATERIMNVHRVLIGPRGEARSKEFPGVAVVRRLESDRQVKLWVRGNPDPLPAPWQSHSASLEEIVMAYMANAAAPPALQVALEVAS